MGQLITQFLMKYSFLFILFSLITYVDLNAQCTNTSTVLVDFSFDQARGPGIPRGYTECNGAVVNSGPRGPLNPQLWNNYYQFCPIRNNGCGIAILGSQGMINTGNYAGAICLAGFYDGDPMTSPGWDPTSTVWHPESPSNIYINYNVPAGSPFCLTNFSLKYLQRIASNGPNFEKMGLQISKNGVIIFDGTIDLLPSHINNSVTFNLPSSSEFCTDGSGPATFNFIFGLVHLIVPATPGGGTATTGFDDMQLHGFCGGSPLPSVSVVPSTCNASGSNNDGQLSVINFAPTDTYQYSLGATFDVGTAVPSSPTVIPTNGILSTVLPNPPTPQPYTVRITSIAGCIKDLLVSLNPSNCPSPPTVCTNPSAALVSSTPSSCGSNNGTIIVSGVTNGNKVALSTGTSFNGPLYNSANLLVGGAFTFTNIVNPIGSQSYVVRVYNGADDCITDYPISIFEVTCPCKSLGIEIVASDQFDIDSYPNNGVFIEDDYVTYEFCKTNNNIDLRLSISVNPSSGTMCGTSTDYVWTTTITNDGTMAASDIQVPNGVPLSFIVSNAVVSMGTYYPSAGWLIPSLNAGQSATMTITTKATIAGTFSGCSEIKRAFPDNDPDSTPANLNLSEDDYSCATATVTGANPPQILKEFSNVNALPNTPIKLILKLINNEATSISLTSPLVDNLPSTPGQMVIAPSPNLSTNIPGVIANANGTSITIPSGTVLPPGSSEISLNVVAPNDGTYTNTINIGDLKTSLCDNILQADAYTIVNSAGVMSPNISKTMLPNIINPNTNSILTLTIENRNSASITLTKDFLDILPENLMINGAVSGTCPGATAFNSQFLVGISSGSVLASGSCTVIVPVTSSTVGTYCNTILKSSLEGTISVSGNTLMTSNLDVPEACLQITNGPLCSTSQTHTTPVCNNNSTGGNAADDYFSFSMTGTVTDGSGNYVVKIGAWTSPSIVSGQAVSIVGNGLSGNPSLPANGSNITVRVEDAVTSTCFTTFTVSSAACSNCPSPNCGTVTVQKN